MDIGKEGYALLIDRRLPLLTCGIYLLCFFLWLPVYTYQLSSDAISYLSIAKHYADGNGEAALNGFWSPLFSWLLIPAYWLQVDVALFARLLNGLIGLVGIWQLHPLLKKLSLPIGYHLPILTGSILLFCWYSLMIISPDVMVVVLILSYLRLWVNAETLTPSLSWKVGVIILLGYFIKTYLLPILLLHTVWVVLRDSRSSWQEKGKWSIPLLLIVGVVVLSWMYMLFLKYDSWTIGFAGEYNWRLMGSLPIIQPYEMGNLLPPVHTAAISAWEDPSYQMPAAWSLREYPTHLLILLKHNFTNFFGGKGFQVVTLCMLPFSVWYMLEKKKDAHISLLLGFYWMYPVGYWLIVLEQRYVWVNHLLGVVLICLLVDRYLQRAPLIKWSILMAMLYTLTFTPAIRLMLYANQGVYVYEEGTAMAQDIPKGSTYATDQDWGIHLYLAYYADLTYWGKVKGENDQMIEKKLLARQIDFFAGDKEKDYDFSQYERLSLEQDYSFSLYRRIK